MRDSRAEDRLRWLLRAEGDSLPLTITTAELERRLEARRRAAKARRVSYMAAAVAMVAIGTLVAGANGWISLPAVGTVSSSPSPAPSPLASPAAVATESPTAAPTPARSPLGAPDQAVLVRPLGDPTHPTGFVVTRVDPIAGRSTLIATIPQSVLPKNLSLNGIPSISTTGWLAIPYDGAANVAGGQLLILIVDVTDPTAEPWIVDGYGQMAWTASDQLGLSGFDGIYLDDPGTRRQTFVPIQDPSVTTQLGPPVGVVWSTEPGTMMLARRGSEAKPDWGSVDTSGRFIPATDLPPAYQRTGLERLTGVAAHSLAFGQPCIQGPGTSQSHCSLIESDMNSTPVATRLPVQDMTRRFEYVWAADGRGLWLLTTDGAGTSTVARLEYSPVDTGRQEIARLALPVLPDGILGITDESEPGSALVAVGVAGHVRAFVAPGGSVTTQDGTAWFAGWAGDQPPYDPD